jgi:hypothetical protein
MDGGWAMMKRDFIGKITAAVLLGSLFGWYIHHDETTWSLRGREAFNAYQMHRFDLYIASPHPLVYSIFVTALWTGGFCAVYELLTFWIAVGLRGVTSEKKFD